MSQHLRHFFRVATLTTSHKVVVVEMPLVVQVLILHFMSCKPFSKTSKKRYSKNLASPKEGGVMLNLAINNHRLKPLTLYEQMHSDRYPLG